MSVVTEEFAEGFVMQGGNIELKLTIEPVDDATMQEAADVASDIRNSMKHLADIEELSHSSEPSPGLAKAGELISLMSLAIKLGPVFLEQMLEMIRELLNRPGTPPVEVVVEDGDRKTSVRFDPRTTTPAEIANMATKLRRDIVSK